MMNVSEDTQIGSLDQSAKAGLLSLRKDRLKALRVFTQNRTAVLGSIIVGVYLLAAILAPWLTRYSPEAQTLSDRLLSPSRDHLLGMDDMGRDVLSRILFGARISISIALEVVGLAGAVGVTAGLLSGYYGGRWDNAIMGVIDLLMSVPTLITAIAIVSVLGASARSLVIAIGLTSIPAFARLTRGAVLKVKSREHVMAAKAIGASNMRIIGLHLLPNVIYVVIVQASLGLGMAILLASALGFLGLGVQPPSPEWGTMLSRGRTYIYYAPHLVIIPGLTIFFLVLGFNLLGDGLRDAMDPLLRGRQ